MRCTETLTVKSYALELFANYEVLFLLVYQVPIYMYVRFSDCNIHLFFNYSRYWLSVMSEKEGAVSDEGSVPPKEVKGSSNKKAASKNKKVPEKSSKKESTPVEEPEESTSSSQENETDKSKPKKKENENDKSTPRKKKSYYVEVEEDDKRGRSLDGLFSYFNLIELK